MKCNLTEIFKLSKYQGYGRPSRLILIADDNKGRALFFEIHSEKFANVHYLKSGDIYKVDDELEYWGFEKKDSFI